MTHSIFFVAKCKQMVYTISWFYMLPKYALLAKWSEIWKEIHQMQDVNYTGSEGRSIDVQRLLTVLWKGIGVILAVSVVFGVAAYLYSTLFIQPTYRSSFSAYINNKTIIEESASTSTSDLSASKGLMYVYQEVVASRTVLVEAAKKSGLYEKGYTLTSDMVNVTVSEKAPVLKVSVLTPDRTISKKFAEAIAEIAPEHVDKVVPGSTMSLIDQPITPSRPYAPNVWNNTVTGALIGLALAVLILIAIDLFHDYVHGSDDMEERYQIPVIGHIPDVFAAQKNDDKYALAAERGNRQ